MQPELEGRIDGLARHYRTFELTVVEITAGIATAKTFTARHRRVAGHAAHQAFRTLTEASHGSLGALIRVGYVRGGRQHVPKFRLDEESQLQVAHLHTETDRLLRVYAQYGLNRVTRVARLTTLGAHAQAVAENPTQSAAPALKAVMGARKPPVEPWGLEQHARVLLRNVTQRALEQGALAAERDAGYALTS